MDSVKTPKTEIVKLNKSETPPTADTVLNIMKENSWSRAFIRSMQKAAPRNLQKGSIIYEAEHREIQNTLESLIAQTSYSEWNTGGSIAVREFLDVDFCKNPSHTMCTPEIRFFIEGGEIRTMTPERADVSCEMSYDYLEETIKESDIPLKQAQAVADEFTKLPWAVDFVLTTSGDWVCVELNLDGVRKDDNGRWRNMCGYGEKQHLSPEVIHPLHWF